MINHWCPPLRKLKKDKDKNKIGLAYMSESSGFSWGQGVILTVNFHSIG